MRALIGDQQDVLSRWFMIKINFLPEPAAHTKRSSVKSDNWWISGLIAILCLAFGVVILRFGDNNALANRLDRTFQDWLIDACQLPKRFSIPVTLVEMEDAKNWTALEYALFLKALPQKNAPVVIFESLPADGNSAFNRAFNEQAIKQPRLVLPLHLSRNKTDPELANWWLRGWTKSPGKKDIRFFTAVETGPPEALRGIVEVGVAHQPATGDLAPLYFQLGGNKIPSLAFRAALLARKIPSTKVTFDSTLRMGEQHLKTTTDGSLLVDTSFLPGMRRIASSDLLLNLAPDSLETPQVAEELRGVIVLGDSSEKARTIAMADGKYFSYAEWVAATVATICNGPILTMVTWPIRGVILALSVLATFLFAKVRGGGKIFTLLFVLALSIPFALYLAERYALTLPVALPLGVMMLGVILHYLADIILHLIHARK